MGNGQITIARSALKKAMGIFVFMAFSLSLPLFAHEKESLIFIVIQGDQFFSYVERDTKNQVVRTDLPDQILLEFYQAIEKSSSNNVILFFDGLNSPSFIKIYKKGELVQEERGAEDFTDPSTFASILKKGYDLFPNHRYLLYHWGYTIPPYPAAQFDISHPEHSYDITSFAKAFELAESFKPSKKLDTLILSTCYNSSWEVLSALYPYVHTIIATEIYLHHHGLSFFHLLSSSSPTASQIYASSLEKLERLIPKGPASGKPILDYSVTLLNTEPFEQFLKTLQSLFSPLQDRILKEGNPLFLKESFEKAWLKNSRNKPYLPGLLDLKSFIEESGLLASEEEKNSFDAHFQNVVLAHHKTSGGNDSGLNFSFFDFNHSSLLTTLRSKIWEGTLDDQGNFFGRLGTHVLILPDSQRIYLKSSRGRHLLDRFLSSNKARRFSISGELRLEKGLWVKSQGFVIDVTEIEVIR